MADRWRAIQNPWWEHPDTVAWRENVAAQIEAVRLEDAPARCDECGCTAHPPAETRRCWRCGETKALSAFHRTAKRQYGRHYECRMCRNKENAKFRARNKIRMFRAAVSGVAV